MSTLDSQDLPTAWGPGGAAGGALVGALVGLLAGPGGAAAGTAAGAAAASSGAAAGAIGGGATGSLADLTNWGLKADYLDTAATYLVPGKTAVVAEVEEGSTGPIDAAVAAPWRHRLPRGGHDLTRHGMTEAPARRLTAGTVTGPRCSFSAAPGHRNGGTTAWIPARRINWLAPGSG